MDKKDLNQIVFDNILKVCINSINKDIINHTGIINAMKKKLQFEKWYQIELYKRLINNFQDYAVDVYLEYELSGKESKRGSSIDLVIKKNSEDFIGLELKIIATNYKIDGFEEKTKSVTDVINSFVSDIDKTKDFKFSYSLAMIYPFPISQNHRNHEDFKKQENRMLKDEKMKLQIIEEVSFENFISKFYLISKIN